jgi:hypothetical protein
MRNMDAILLGHGQSVLTEVTKAQKNPIVANPTWITNVPYLGGVYVIWKKADSNYIPIYVGESSNLRDRLDEMTRLGRHNALWKLTDREGIKIRNISILASPEIKGLEVSYIKLPVGRKEAEEYLIALWRPSLINKQDKRFQRRSDWVDFKALSRK